LGAPTGARGWRHKKFHLRRRERPCYADSGVFMSVFVMMTASIGVGTSVVFVIGMGFVPIPMRMFMVQVRLDRRPNLLPPFNRELGFKSVLHC